MGNIHTVGPNEALIVSGNCDLTVVKRFSSDDARDDFDISNNKILGEANKIDDHLR